MNLDNLLRNLIKNESDKMKKYVLFMLVKFSNNVKMVENDSDYLPLLVMKNDRLLLIYKDDELDDLEYIFSDYEEILIILQKIFNSDKIIYFYFEMPEKILTYEEIIEKINESLQNNDKEMFLLYSTKLKK